MNTSRLLPVSIHHYISIPKMAQPVTECATIVLKPGVDIEGHTQEAKIWKETLKIVSEQDGYQREYYGRQLENPNVLMLLIGMSSNKLSYLDYSSPMSI